MTGVIVVDKPKGISSGEVVKVIKRLSGEKRTGHFGTLDPLATGVLPVCIGKATRLFEHFLKKRKTYLAEFTFGFQTTTLDMEGEIEKKSSQLPSEKQLKTAIKEHFLGKIMQLPPVFSAKKIAGKKAYDLARQGLEVNLSPKEIEIFSFEVLKKIDDKTFEFEIECSAGTYIRSLARDLAKAVGSVGTMSNLRRTKTGNFSLKRAVSFETLTKENIAENLISLKDILTDFEKVEVDTENFQKLRNGTKIELNRGKRPSYEVCVWCENEIVGLGKVEDDSLKITTYFV